MTTTLPKSTSYRIHRRIILTFILTTLFAVLLVGTTLRYVLEKTTMENWEKKQGFITAEFAPQCDLEIDEAKRTLEFLSKLPAFLNLPYVDQIDRTINGIPENVDLEKRNILQKLVKPRGRFTTIFILRPNGDLYLVSPFKSQLRSKKYNFADRPYFKEAARTKRPFISGSFLGATGIPIVVLTIPIIDKAGAIKFYICGAYFLTHISQLVNKKQIHSFDMGFIVDQKGHLIGHTDINLVKEEYRKKYTDHTLVSQFIDKGRNDVSKLIIQDCVDPIDGKTYLTSFMPLNSGWGLGLALSKETILSEIRPVVWRITFLISFIIIVVGTIGMLFTRWIGKHWFATEKSLIKQTGTLTERNKELNCLYGISSLLENPNPSLGEIFQGIVDLIPPSLQYPEITCSRILLEDKEYKTENFKETNWKQSNEIFVTGKRMGVLEICYLEEKPEIDKGPFLKEERNLIDAIAERLGRIIERMRAREKQERLESQLQHARKMESIGTLAGGIAHNFNNLLMGIQGNASMMFLDIDSSHPRHKNLKNIEKLVDNGAKLTGQLIGYAREGKYEVKPISLNQLVKDTSDTFGMTKREITVHQELFEDLHGIEADQGQIEQILLNLYINAVEAMPGGGDLYLKTMNVTDKDMIGKLYKATPGNYVLLSVKDTGVGMDYETRKRIFEPFFTTKGLASGTGLGLASTYGIVKGHGGYIDVDSEKGKGTTFSIYLPATEEMIEEKKVLSDELVKGKGTVLLVDDEKMFLEVGEELLTHLEYEVLLAENGREALELYKKNQDKIDLVLLDMVMPVMGGGEAFDRMKEINTNVKVLLSSGYSLEGEAKEILKRGCDAFIQKPFKMEQLSQKLREILDEK